MSDQNTNADRHAAKAHLPQLLQRYRNCAFDDLAKTGAEIFQLFFALNERCEEAKRAHATANALLAALGAKMTACGIPPFNDDLLTRFDVLLSQTFEAVVNQALEWEKRADAVLWAAGIPDTLPDERMVEVPERIRMLMAERDEALRERSEVRADRDNLRDWCRRLEGEISRLQTEREEAVAEERAR